MKVKPGVRVRSVVCGTEAIVVVAPDDDVALGCGGQLMEVIERGSSGPGGSAKLPIDSGLAGGTLLGKRYVAEGAGVELLITKAGEGTLTMDGQPLTIKNSKPLPSSD